jgi:hypothetical protein
MPDSPLDLAPLIVRYYHYFSSSLAYNPCHPLALTTCKPLYSHCMHLATLSLHFYS